MLSLFQCFTIVVVHPACTQETASCVFVSLILSFSLLFLLSFLLMQCGCWCVLVCCSFLYFAVVLHIPVFSTHIFLSLKCSNSRFSSCNFPHCDWIVGRYYLDSSMSSKIGAIMCIMETYLFQYMVSLCFKDFFSPSHSRAQMNRWERSYANGKKRQIPIKILKCSQWKRISGKMRQTLSNSIYCYLNSSWKYASKLLKFALAYILYATGEYWNRTTIP